MTVGFHVETTCILAKSCLVLISLIKEGFIIRKFGELYKTLSHAVLINKVLT